MNGYQFKISVKGSTAPIYRTVKVPGTLSFLNLHQAIQDIFGLNDMYTFAFYIESENVWIVDFDDDDDDNFANDIEPLDCLEKIRDFFKPGMVIDYYYDSKQWIFTIEIEEMLEVEDAYPIVIDYEGNDLIEDCGGIKGYEKLLSEYEDIDEIAFDLESTNIVLSMYEVDEVLNEHEFCREFTKKLAEIMDLISKRNIVTYQVFKLVSQKTSYWVAIKTQDSYVIEFFKSYDDLLEGFYNLPEEGIHHAFCNCWTLLLTTEPLDREMTLDDEQKYAAFRNEAGFVPVLLGVSEAKEIYSYLEDFMIGICGDDNQSEEDEIIEICLEDGVVSKRDIFVHEPNVDFSRYDFDYYGDTKINTEGEGTGVASLDIIALPSSETALSDELGIYAVIAGEQDYLIKEVYLPTLEIMGETLIDAIIEYSNRYGKPRKVATNNLNVLFLVIGFIGENDIDYIQDDISPEIEAAVIDGFGLNKVMDAARENPFVKELLEMLEGTSEDEIEDKLDEILAGMEIIN